MDIGLSHVVTVDGKIIPTYWDAFNPNLAAGVIQEILLFEKALDLATVYNELENYIAKDDYSGQFYLANKTGNLYNFTADYSIAVETEDDLQIKSFLFVTDGKPWAICNLETAIPILAGNSAVFNFASSVKVNSKGSVSNNLWSIQVDKFTINYSAMVYPVNLQSGQVVMSSSKAVTSGVDDETVASILASGTVISPEWIYSGDKIGINLVAKTKTEYVGVRAIFIRILWNLGIMIYIDSIEYAGQKLDGLTLARGHQLSMTFGLKFSEV